MATPFGGSKTSQIIPIYNWLQDSATVPDQNSTGSAVATGVTASLEVGRYVDFSKLIGNFYFEVIYGHVNLTNNSTSYIQLFDQTNNTALATATTVSTASIVNFFHASSEVGFITFTKPASTAKVLVRIFNGDNVNRTFYLWRANIWIVPS